MKASMLSIEGAWLVREQQLGGACHHEHVHKKSAKRGRHEVM